MADRARIIALRGGSRGSATKLVQKLHDLSADINLSLPEKVYSLERKLADLKIRVQAISTLDTELFAATDPDSIVEEMDATDDVNSSFRDAIDLYEFQILNLKNSVPPTTPVVPSVPAIAPIAPLPSTSAGVPTRSSNRPKINLPRFRGDILQWQAFWQAFESEIDSDSTTANVNKFNYLVGQLDPEVAIAVAGLTPSNENYPELVKLLQERYGRKSKIVAAYMRALYGLPKPEYCLTSLRSFYDVLESYVRGLDALGKTTDSYGDLLVCILLDKLPSDVRRNLARQHDQDEWTLEQLRAVLRAEIRVLEAGQSTSVPKWKHPAVTINSVTTKPTQPFPMRSCVFCQEQHYPTQCSKSADERMKIAFQKRLCLNCLSDTHLKDHCFSKIYCRVPGCKLQHHTSLHNAKMSFRQDHQHKPPSANVAVSCVSATPLSSEKSACVAPVQQTVSHVSSLTPFTVLKTAVVTVQSRNILAKANVLIDEGSQRTFISRKLSQLLQLHPISKECLILSGFSTEKPNPRSYDVVKLSILDQKNCPIAIQAIVIDHLVNPLDDKLRKSVMSMTHLQGLKLAHPCTDNDSFAVDILVGADIYWSFVGDEKPIRGPGPTAVNSRLGYLVSGPCPDIHVDCANQSVTLHVTSIEESDIDRLWSLEALGIIPNTENLKEAAEYAQHSIERRSTGYVAKFPWKADHPELPNNLSMVRNMTRSIIRRLAQDSSMLKSFNDLIRDQLARGFIETVPDSELSKRCHYIPYHCVRKESVTTPIRIVYNCSCRSWNGVSFNDCVETGAALHNSQFDIILRFRVHSIGIVADVEKAFHHVGLDEQDRDFLRWLWLKNPTDPESEFVVYRFRVVPFGAKPAPFMLNATVIKHLGEESSLIAKDMQRNVFVDNIITGVETKAKALEFYRNANDIMGRAQLPLQAWGFSETSLETSLRAENLVDSSTSSKILGLQWDRLGDSLSVNPTHCSSFCSSKSTMRDVLRGLASVYDPLGFYTPLSTKGKILLQDLHKEKCKFDQTLSDHQLSRWSEITNSIDQATKLKSMSVSRSYFGSASAVHELHVFCDASRRAFGAVAYLLHEERVSFVASKSRICPIKDDEKPSEKELSNPESELMAAYIGSLLAESIISALEAMDIKLTVFMWGDNQVVHFWISKADGHPRPFITNRVKKIREFNSRRASTWKYVSTDQNPADLLSRGISLKEFQSSVLWRVGPTWLTVRKNWPDWSVSQFKCSVNVSTTSEPFIGNNNISSIIEISKYKWKTLARVSALIYRFLNNLKLKDPSRISWNRDFLSPIEIQDAERVWIQLFQTRHFPEEFTYLKSDRKGCRPSLVSQLDLHLSPEGIIRCGGRLTNADICDSAKNPILIPKNCELSKLIVTFYHEKMFHCGVDSTMAHIRQRFWIPSLRQQVKTVYLKCVKCRKHGGPPYASPDAAPLPSIRVKESYPFAITGTDFSGAIPIADGIAYILLFTCGVTRALHLEVVKDMSTRSFIDAFRRFTCHHPIPKIVYSDNATTFVSAGGILVKMFQNPEITAFLSDRQIQWKYIPKRAPWYGGFWERLIGLTKTSLKKMIGRNKVKFHELQNLVCEIEGLLNDRPLTYVSSDVNSLEPLTPSHLLYGQRLTILPYDAITTEELDDPSFNVKASDLNKRLVQLQNIQQSFWRRWRTEYLPALRDHHQKTRGPMKEHIKIGDVVQIHDDCTKRIQWKLAVVENLERGADGFVRSADIRTARGKTNRPVNKLYPIEVCEPLPERSNERVNPSDGKESIQTRDAIRPVRHAALKARSRIHHLARSDQEDIIEN